MKSSTPSAQAGEIGGSPFTSKDMEGGPKPPPSPTEPGEPLKTVLTPSEDEAKAVEVMNVTLTGVAPFFEGASVKAASPGVENLPGVSKNASKTPADSIVPVGDNSGEESSFEVISSDPVYRRVKHPSLSENEFPCAFFGKDKGYVFSSKKDCFSISLHFAKEDSAPSISCFFTEMVEKPEYGEGDDFLVSNEKLLNPAEPVRKFLMDLESECEKDRSSAGHATPNLFGDACETRAEELRSDPKHRNALSVFPISSSFPSTKSMFREAEFPGSVKVQGEAATTAVKNSHRVSVEYTGENRYMPVSKPNTLGSGVEIPLNFVADCSEEGESLYFVEVVSGNAKSRRFQAHHYGLPVAGYLSTRPGEKKFNFNLPEIETADPLVGISHEYSCVVPNAEGLWPFGDVDSRTIHWCRADVIDKEEKGTSYTLVRDIPFSIRGIVNVRGKGKTENVYAGKHGDLVTKIFSSEFSSPVLLRSWIIAYNSVTKECPAYEGAFPSVTDEGGDLGGHVCTSVVISNYEVITFGASLCPTGVAYDGSTFSVQPIGHATQVLEKAISKAISRVPDFNIDFRDPENSLPEAIQRLAEEVSWEAIKAPCPQLQDNHECVVPGTAAVCSRDFDIVERFDCEDDAVPLISQPVHPVTCRAQTLYNRVASQQQSCSTWFDVMLPTREMIRTSVRNSRGKANTFHVGDEKAGSIVRHTSIVNVTPSILLVRCDEPSADLLRAQDALVRAAYMYGSSHGGEFFFGLKSQVKGNIDTSQSYFGLDTRGRLKETINDDDAIPILTESEKNFFSDASVLERRALAAGLDELIETTKSGPLVSAPANREPLPKERPGNPEEDFLNQPLGSPLDEKFHAELLRYIPDMPKVIASSFASRTFSTTTKLPAASDIQRYDVTVGRAVTIDRACSILSCGRVVNSHSENGPTAAEHMDRAVQGCSRSSLLKYVRRAGRLLRFEEQLWRDCSYTWEASNIPSDHSIVLLPTHTWGDLIGACQSDLRLSGLRGDSSFAAAATELESSADGKRKEAAVKKPRSSSPSRARKQRKRNRALNMTLDECVALVHAAHTGTVRKPLTVIAKAIEKIHLAGRSSMLHTALSDKSGDLFEQLARASSSIGALAAQLKKGGSYGPYGATNLDF